MKYALITLLMIQCYQLNAQNSVQNGGFENALTNWYYFSTTNNPSIFKIDNVNFHSGSKSLWMDNNSSADTSYLAQIVPVTAGKKYLCDFWVKADSMEHYMLPFIKFRHDTVGVYDTYFCPNGNVSNWQRVVMRVMVPDGADNMVFFFAIFGKGNFRIDDISLVELTDTTYTSFSVDVNQPAGSFKKLFSVNGIGPGNATQPFNHIQKFQELGVDYMRTHDFQTAFDYSVIFPDTSENPLNPSAYHFHTTDSCITDIINAGGKVYFRFGQSYDTVLSKKIPPANMEKFAQVCVQIIKHYNDGWNNGFHYNLQYFEIWNEPDIKDFWRGTVNDYIRLYRLTAHAIKSYNPLLKVGGPVVSNVFDESFSTVFIDSVVTEPLPLDFFVYHLYYFYNPYYFKVVNEYVRNKLNNAGLTNIELINSEWNSYMFSFDTYSEWGADDALNASSAASALIYMQESTVGKFFRYALDNYWFGMINWYDQWRYSGLAMLALRELMDNGQRLSTSGSDTLGTCIIASSGNNETDVLLTDNSSNARGYTLQMQDLNPVYIYQYRIFRIDSANKYFIVNTGEVSSQQPTIVQTVKPPYTDHIIFTQILSSSYTFNDATSYIFPNPCTDEFKLMNSGLDGKNVTLILSDIYGRVVNKWHATNMNSSVSFSVKNIPPSIYLLTVETPDKMQYKYKLIIK
jgi:hypothetical protein